MGASSLVLTAVGFGVGRFREVRDPSHGLMPVPVGAAATAGWVITFAAVSFMLDVGARVSPLVIRDMVLTVLLNALLWPSPCSCSSAVSCARRWPWIRSSSGRRRRPPRETGPLGLRGLEI